MRYTETFVQLYLMYFIQSVLQKADWKEKLKNPTDHYLLKESKRAQKVCYDDDERREKLLRFAVDELEYYSTLAPLARGVEPLGLDMAWVSLRYPKSPIYSFSDRKRIF